MTRSGLAAATLAAICANGHNEGLLQSWNLPPSSSTCTSLPLLETFLALRRQPVSPNAMIEVSVGFGSGRGEFAMLADPAPAGIDISHTSTGKGPPGPLSGNARTFISRAAPSMLIAGQWVVPVSTARAIAPCAPSTT